MSRKTHPSSVTYALLIYITAGSTDMIKQLLSLTEHSLEVSSKLGMLDRLDDSLSAIRMYTKEDVSTESSSALLRAIGIQSNKDLSKDVILHHLDKLQIEVAKEVFMRGRDINGVLDELLVQAKRTYIELNKNLMGKDQITMHYLLHSFDLQTVQVNGKSLKLNEFYRYASEFNRTLSLVGDTLYSGIIDLTNSSLEKPDKGFGTYLVTNLPNNQSYLNNATLSYKRDSILGWRFYFNVKRREVAGSVNWVIDYKEQVALRALLGDMIETLTTVSKTISFSGLLELYRKDKKANKGVLDLVGKFYMPMVISHIRVIYLISDILREYLEKVRSNL